MTPEEQARDAHRYTCTCEFELKDPTGCPSYAAIADALREERARYDGFNGMVVFIKERLEEFYPADIFDGSSHESGPEFVVALRRAVEQLDARVEKGDR